MFCMLEIVFAWGGCCLGLGCFVVLVPGGLLWLVGVFLLCLRCTV